MIQDLPGSLLTESLGIRRASSSNLAPTSSSTKHVREGKKPTLSNYEEISVFPEVHLQLKHPLQSH